MSYLIPKANNYFGLVPVSYGGGGSNHQVNFYLVSSSQASIYKGDVVWITSSGITGTVGPVNVQAMFNSTSTANPMIGVAAATLLSGVGMTASSSQAAGPTLLVNTSMMLPVYDNPNQFFAVCDTTSFTLGSSFLWKNVTVACTGVTGSTGNPFSSDRSVMALSGNTASSNAGGPFKLVGLHPVEQGLYSTVSGAASNAVTDVRKWIVYPNVHAYGHSSGTVAWTQS